MKKQRKTNSDVLKFAYKEAELYNTLFSHNVRREMQPIPQLVASRVQTRLNLFEHSIYCNGIDHILPDVATLYRYIRTLVQRQDKVDYKFSMHYHDVTNGRPSSEFAANGTFSDSLVISAMFLYSTLDFIRNCEFESDEECPIDLADFARITDDVILPIALLNK